MRDGEEECLCTFVLFWLHGPNFDYLSVANIANLCVIQDAAKADPRIAYFMKFAKEKMPIACSKSCIGCEHYTSTLGGPLSCEEVICLSSNKKSSSESKLQASSLACCFIFPCMSGWELEVLDDAFNCFLG